MIHGVKRERNVPPGGAPRRKAKGARASQKPQCCSRCRGCSARSGRGRRHRDAAEDLSVGLIYGRERGDEYWRAVKRANANLGTVTTQSLSVVGHYGLTDRLTLVSALPYVWTGASEGTLHGLSGVQDFTVAASRRD